MQHPDGLLFKNAFIIDGLKSAPFGEAYILVQGSRIAAISKETPDAPGAAVIDLAGRFVMPGLIDCHAHPFLADTNLARLNEVPLTLMTARASNIVHRMLMRGFTTIRDAAGGDWGIKKAVEDGEVIGPRMFISGRALSQTGGHGDFRRRTDSSSSCRCADALAMTSVIADGVDEVRKAVREQLRLGADQIKIMVSGGVASPHDPLERDQYSFQEIQTIVEEAERRGTYVMAHAYGASAIKTAVQAGVRSIEHGNLIDAQAAALVVEKGAYVVPTLVTYAVLKETGVSQSWSSDMLGKLKVIHDVGLQSIELCKAAGVKLGFGTDLLGQDFDAQSREFLIRGEIESPGQVINSATRINAEILQRSGELGEISVGAAADLIVLTGNPLEDLELLQDDGAHMPLIMKAGKIYKNTLH